MLLVQSEAPKRHDIYFSGELNRAHDDSQRDILTTTPSLHSDGTASQTEAVGMCARIERPLGRRLTSRVLRSILPTMTVAAVAGACNHRVLWVTPLEYIPMENTV